MDKVKIKTYTIDGKKMVFNTDVFEKLFQKKKKEVNSRVLAYQEVLGDLIGVSSDTIRAWRMGKNGPSDVETIQKLAEIWDVKFEVLVKESVEMVVNTKLDDRTRQVVVECYKKLEDFFEDYSEGTLTNFLDVDDICRNILYYKDEMSEEEMVGIYRFDESMSKEERIKELREMLSNIHSDFYKEMYSIKKMLKQNMLEIPSFIYNRWNELITTASDYADAYFRIPESSDDYEEWAYYMDSIENLYFEFYDFCKESVVPCIQ